MPKMILEFNLPEEQEEAELARRGMDYHSLLHDWGQLMRGWDKHGLPQEWQTLKPEQLIHEVRQKWFEMLRDHNVQI